MLQIIIIKLETLTLIVYFQYNTSCFSLFFEAIQTLSPSWLLWWLEKNRLYDLALTG